MELGSESHAAPQLAEPGRGAQDGRHASIPDLMQEFRAGVQDALSWLDAARAEPGANAPQTVSASAENSERAAQVRPRVSPELLEQMTLTLGEVRHALAALRATHDLSVAASDRVPAASSELQDARLVAVNMALNGAPQAETERYLERNFPLQDGEDIAAAAYRRAQRLADG